MARVLDEIPAWAFRRGPGRRELYPYDEWLDGQVHELTSGEDFMVNIRTMRSYIKAAAKRRGCEVVCEHDGEILIVWKRQHGSVPVGKVTTHDEALDEALAEITDYNYRGLSEDEAQETLDRARALRRPSIDLDVLDPEVAVRRHAL